MSNYEGFFKDLKTRANCGEKGRVLEVLLNALRYDGAVSQTDLAEMKAFVFGEIGGLSKAIESAPDYKTKDGIFYYEDKLMGLFTFICAKKVAVTEDEFSQISELVKTVAKYQVLETAVTEMCELEKITADDAKKVIAVARPLTDEYQKGLFYQGLLNYEKSLKNFTAEAKAVTADYVASEIERYLKIKDKLTEDEINNLEFAADICKHFTGEKTVALLNRLAELPHNNIRYYAAATLLSCNQTVPANVISELAHDLNYADLTYCLLKSRNLANMFPAELADPEYLAKSDLVHWLTYPTELGKVPDEIVLLGDVKVKGEKFYIFKYKSDSDNLSDELKNEWLIGWSSDEGGTFSNFDRLCDYEQKKPAKTLKVIKKKLIG